MMASRVFFASPRGVMGGLSRAALLASTALTVIGSAAPARAQVATWSASPSDGTYNDAANWIGAVVPNGEAATAVFGASTQTNLSITSDTGSVYAVDGWTFNAGASNYSFRVNNGVTLGFWGAGIAVNGGSVAITNNGTVNFFGNSSAGAATTTITNDINGYLRFYALISPTTTTCGSTAPARPATPPSRTISA
jgi:fibronectin-binding autotransporter adhesin